VKPSAQLPSPPTRSTRGRELLSPFSPVLPPPTFHTEKVCVTDLDAPPALHTAHWDAAAPTCSAAGVRSPARLGRHADRDLYAPFRMTSGGPVGVRYAAAIHV